MRKILSKFRQRKSGKQRRVGKGPTRWSTWQVRFTANARTYADAVRAGQESRVSQLFHRDLALRLAAAKDGYLYTDMMRMAAIFEFPSPETIDDWESKYILALAGGIPGGFEPEEF